MRILAGFLVVAASMLAVPSAAARDIFVSNAAGNDTFSGRSAKLMSDRTGPVRTIAKALRLAQRGDRIVLEKTDKPYAESISLVGSRHSGYPFKPFVIEGNGAILDGSAPVPPEAWEHYRDAVFRFRPPRSGHQQLFLNDRPAIRVAAATPADGPPTLEPLQWCLKGGSIYFCVELTKLPEDYPLTYSDRRVGITLVHVARVVIRDLTIQGFQLDGINAHNNARRVSLLGITCRGNGRSGITVGGASLVDIDKCLLGDNGAAQLLTLLYSETHIYSSQLLSNTAPAWLDQGGHVYMGDKRIEGGIDEREDKAAEETDN